jgi:hypothetical protein
MRIRSTPGRLAVPALIAALVLAMAVPALAAHPVKGATYIGTLRPDATLPPTIKLKVSGSGKLATAYLYCGTTQVDAVRKLKISSNGSFKGTHYTGSLKTMSIKGRFASSDSVHVLFHPYSDCPPGGKLTLERKGS